MIQYLSWMLNNIYCVPDEKDSRKHVLLFIFIYISFEEKKKRNAALNFTSSKVQEELISWGKL